MSELNYSATGESLKNDLPKSNPERGPGSNYDQKIVQNSFGVMGLLPSFQISADSKEKLENLDKFPLDREMRVIREDRSLDLTLRERGIPTLALEFKRFMSLGILFPDPKYNFAPSRPVDRMWHELILDTKRYHAMCMQVYGAYVHHHPLDPEQIATNAGEVMRYTKECITAAYGAPVPWIWGGSNWAAGSAAKFYYTSECDQYACC